VSQSDSDQPLVSFIFSRTSNTCELRGKLFDKAIQYLGQRISDWPRRSQSYVVRIWLSGGKHLGTIYIEYCPYGYSLFARRRFIHGSGLIFDSGRTESHELCLPK